MRLLPYLEEIIVGHVRAGFRGGERDAPNLRGLVTQVCRPHLAAPVVSWETLPVPEGLALDL